MADAQQKASAAPVIPASAYVLPVLAALSYVGFLAYTWQTYFAGVADPIGRAPLPAATWQAATGGYLLGVGVLYRVMAARGKAFNVRAWMNTYNVLLVCLSAAMFVGLARETLWPAITRGAPLWDLTLDRSAKGSALAFWLWVNYQSKFLEYADTVWMLLNCKFEQVSFLHVEHHAVMGGIMWLVTNDAPGGSSYFAPMINAFIHTIMYTWYTCAALKIFPGVVKAIKSKVTALQITQFVIITGHALYHYVLVPDVFWPRHLAAVEFLLMVNMLALFGHFFYSSYVQKKAKKA